MKSLTIQEEIKFTGNTVHYDDLFQTHVQILPEKNWVCVRIQSPNFFDHTKFIKWAKTNIKGKLTFNVIYPLSLVMYFESTNDALKFKLSNPIQDFETTYD